ncbi:MAG: hypothetical protein KME60_08525 [Cyanomargarita calcarea GSE-NOS-MK-12-04C]|jgi:hypothetical protein|uniref:Uncharacterized protein n=1 Tax=Cyanomargarita calcarea GSE-NOS-MK-12-04C TaxID=2839659 RepID=A0A951QKB9_9CYAN|nr:hypothetical protein [Cyanomargarita calcarea GSE-NOS-MK-12-04C]
MRVLVTALTAVSAVFALLEFCHEAKASSSLIALAKENTVISSLQTNEISTHLPPGLVMRLPNQVLLTNNLDGQDNKYSVEVLRSSPQAPLRVNIFNCEQQANCLASSITIVSEKEFKQFQNIATPITLANKISGYLLEEQGEKVISDYSEIMWQQDNQFYKVSLKAQFRENLLEIVNSMVDSTPIKSTKLADSSTEKPEDSTKSIEESNLITPSRRAVLTTAEQLRAGEILTTIRQRHFFQKGTAARDGLTDQPTIGVTWGVKNNFELTLDAQTVDNAGPVRQGRFDAQRINSEGSTNFFQEFTLQGKHRVWQNENATQAVSAVVAASLGNGKRPYRFSDNSGISAAGLNRQTVFSLELPYTITPNDQWQFTLSPKVAFLPEDNALYLTKLPIANSGSFGTTFGLGGGVSYKLNHRLVLWGDAFVPFSGNNTISRDTGLPAKSIVYNAGLRYIINPRLSADLFLSNALGNTGALSLIADKEYNALGFSINYLPGITNANRRYAESFNTREKPAPNTYAGFGFLDGGTVRQNQLLTTLQVGGQGLLPSVRYGLLDDFEIGAFLSNIPGTVDESQFGFSSKIRLLHQADGNPFTLSLAGTLARSNNVLTNFVNNNRNRFQQLGLKKGGFAYSNEREGELFIYTLSAPIHYQFQGGSAAWVTPTLGFVQRSGLEIAGLNFGGSVPLSQSLDAIAEVGVNMKGSGNAFIGNQRESVIPWTLGLRWKASSLFGEGLSGLELEAYISNRLGSSPFDSLRVRADNETTVGVGLLLPIQF